MTLQMTINTVNVQPTPTLTLHSKSTPPTSIPVYNTQIFHGIRVLCFLWLFNMHFISMLFIAFDTTAIDTYFDTYSITVQCLFRSHYAVQLFHIISSYLLTYKLLQYNNIQNLQSTRSGIQYIYSVVKYRIIRLAPVLYVTVVLILLLSLFISGIQHTHNALYTILFVQNFIPTSVAFLPHAWTISLDVQWCIMLPCIMLLIQYIQYNIHSNNTNKQYNIILSVTIVLLILTTLCRWLASIQLYNQGLLELPNRFWGVDMTNLHTLTTVQQHTITAMDATHTHIYMSLFCRLESFLCGMLLAYMHYYKFHTTVYSSIMQYTHSKFILCCLIIAVVMYPRNTSHLSDTELYTATPAILYITFNRLLFALSSTALLQWAMINTDTIIYSTVNKFLSNDIFRFISPLTYTCYIWHVLVHGSLLKRTVKLSTDITTIFILQQTTISLIITLILSYVIHKYVELPGIKLLQNKTDKHIKSV